MNNPHPATSTPSRITPVILCGGSGTRLWPLSRKSFPKQFVPLINDKSLLDLTLERVARLSEDSPDSPDSPRVICVAAEEHRFFVADAMRAAGAGGLVVLEPCARNTAPAMALAALAQTANDLLLFCPADHHIPDAAAFAQMVRAGAPAAANGAIVTFGITPSFPATGYGYIETKPSDHTVLEVVRFIEKPSEDKAAQMILAGHVFWNAGIFLASAQTVLDALRVHAPDILAAATAAMQGAGADALGPINFIRPDAAAFAACRAESIDYAVMEKIAALKGEAATHTSATQSAATNASATQSAATNASATHAQTTQSSSTQPTVKLIPFHGQWSDVGSWSAVAELSPADAQGNRTHGQGIAIQSTDTFVHAPNRPVVTLGTQSLLVIDTPDALLVVAKTHTEQVKHVVAELERRESPQAGMHRKVARPWGWYDSVDMGDRFQVKRISVKPGASLSLQMHHHRAEHWVVVKGTARVTRGDEIIMLSENQSTYIPLGVKHRLENPGSMDLEIIEVQSGSYLGEDDIVRFEDHYGRS